MPSNSKTAEEIQSSLVQVTNWARSNCEWDKVYQYIVLNPADFFAILPDRRWSISHQVVLHGNVDLFKRFLALFSDENIDIRIKTKDNKTFLDIAKEQQSTHQAMYSYIEHLFLQDELIEQAKQSNWRDVIEILEKDNKLANEKPPYSPCFLIHYVIENSDTYNLELLLDKYKCLTNVRNSDGETPLELAKRLKKYDMCSILEPKLETKRNTISTTELSISIQNLDRSNERLSYDSIISSDKSLPLSSPSTTPKTASSTIGFGKILNDLQYNNFQFEQPNTINSDHSQSRTPYQQKQSGISPIKHVEVNRSIISECPLTDVNPISSTISNEHVAKNLKNPSNSSSPTVSMVSTSSHEDLTNEVKSSTTNTNPTSSDISEQFMRAFKCPLTQKFFVDPVIASDGHTYERLAILDWIKVHRCSPTTGKPMDATVRDNIEIKKVLQTILRQS
ncbi:unnamed protein product [Rotaria sp. Silwood1]|nr:unnamed protein product [Rotaria sp. Silwood1]CAF3593266.1 unnamed protein product [Rotaria sp. Silwood1]CAF3658380.1 unnamed protein product [Rotaria sp. Silwood1]CAF4541966.1 unnamed protein product [Rotaria sp. Silwood1]